jgi:hypothetical protein
MGLNGSPGQEQLARDVRVGPATGDQTGDPGLGVGQGLPATRRAAVQRAGATPDAVGPHPRLHAPAVPGCTEVEVGPQGVRKGWSGPGRFTRDGQPNRCLLQGDGALERPAVPIEVVGSVQQGVGVVVQLRLSAPGGGDAANVGRSRGGCAVASGQRQAHEVRHHFLAGLLARRVDRIEQDRQPIQGAVQVPVDLGA